MNELLTTTTIRPMEVAFWLLLSLGIAIFLWLCWRNIQRSRRNHLNRILALVLTIAALAMGQMAWAQDPATIGSISYNNTLAAYEIANENNLKDLAVYVNGTGSYTTGGDPETTAHNCEGLTFKVTGPIALTHTTDWDNSGSTEDSFTPIGGLNKSFNGTFDGQGYTISGIRIYQPEATRLGLFGYLSGATVKDVNLSDIRIRGNTIIGGIAGWVLNGGSISGCHATNAFIAGLATTGGIVGSTYGNISDCHVSATVTIHIAGTGNFGTNSFGGIVGSLSKDASADTGISGCTSSATLTVADGVNDYGRCGGIVGESSVTDDRGKISFENCIAVGVTVPASGSSGPVVGYIQNTAFTNTYYLNCTIGGTVNFTGNGYGTIFGDGNTGYKDIKSLHVITFGPGLSGSGGIDVNGDTYYAAGSTVTLSGSTNGYTVTKDGTNPAENVTVNQSGGVYTFTMPAANVTVSGPPDYATLWNEDPDHDGSSEAKAYIITTTDGLKLLADVVNTGDSKNGVFFKLGGNIEYTYNKAWNDATSNENNYTVIGNGGNHSFSGTFDGQGYTISGIRIYRDGKNYTGLFGDLNGGTVKNVRLADARITGSSNIGGIAGYNSQGTVMNCTVAADVCIHAAGENHGGIVGKNSSNTYDHKAIVTACTSSAQLTVATGASGTPIRGGIVGNNSMSYTEVSNCLVLGASILGWGDSENCKYLGAIVGNNSSGTLTNNYYSNCTVGNASSPASTNVGAGSDSGKGDVTTNDGARGIGIITLGTGVSMTGGTTVTVGSTTYYYYAGSVITLSHSDAPTGYTFGGYTAKDAADNNITASVISGSTLTMPATDVTLNVAWRKLMTNTDITVTIPAQTYSGNALTPAVTVTDGTTELTKDTHYTVTLPDGRINAGNYTITITGIGDYDGNTTKTFTITPAPLTVTTGSASKEYDGTALTKDEAQIIGLVNSETATIVATGSQTEVGSSYNTYNITWDGTAVSTNYNITSETLGTLTVSPISIAAREAATNEYWTTYYNSIANLQVDVDTKVYRAAVNTATNKVDLTEITDRIINASQGVVLKSTHQNITATPVTGASTDNYSGNKLQGVDEETAQASGKTYYVLSKPEGKDLGFYKLKNSVNLGAHKAYLEVATTTAPEYLGFDVETTDISPAEITEIADKAGAIYDLQGRKIANGQKPTAKGLYIVNGRKYIIK